MKENKLLKTWELSALIALCITLCLALWAQGRQEAVESRLLRLRVVAASDAPEEQAIKLRVRDAVLACAAPKLEGVTDALEAETILAAEAEAIRSAAECAAEGREVRVEFCDERIPTRHYGGFALPGLPEGWAQAYPVDTGFIQRNYEKMMEREEKGNV